MKKGITLLIAVFIASVALAVAIGIFSFLYSENQLAVATEDSFAAYRAADSGIDCALYWDIKGTAGDGSQSAFPASPTLPFNIFCGGNTVAVNNFNADTYKFDIDFSANDSSNHSCAHVSITKVNNSASIISLGESKICSSASSNRTVQRGIELDYPY